MSTPCTKSGIVVAGDAVCIIGWDNGPPSQPLVARASRTNLLTSKTVYGVAETVVGTVVNVLVAGEAAKESITSLGMGDSRIVATDITQPDASPNLQCRLIRVDRPDGSEHIIGTCDANGHLAVLPRASRETSAQHVFSVKAYGALGDGRRIDDVFIDDGMNSMSPTTLYSGSPVFTAADTGKTVQVIGAGLAGVTLTTTITYVDAMKVTLASPVTSAVSEGHVLIVGTDDRDAIQDAAVAAEAVSGRLFFPPGIYCPATNDVSIASNVQVFFDEGASIEPNGVNVDIAGLVSCHQHQRVFGGTGYSDAPALLGMGAIPAVTISGDPVVEAVVRLEVVTSGTLGGVPAMQFKFSPDNGATWSTTRTPPAGASYDFPMPGLGIIVTFTGGAYTIADACTWTSYPAITLAADSLHLQNVRNFGAVPDDAMAGATNIVAFRKCLGVAYNSTNPETVRIVAHGQFYLRGTLHVVRPILMDGGGHGDKDTGPGTTLIFPTDFTGIRFHSSDPQELRAIAGAHDDIPDGLPVYRTGASQSELRNVTIRCDVLRGAVPTGVGWQDVYGYDIRANIEAYGHVGHGIHTSTPMVLRDVFVQNFAEHGVYVAAAHGDDAIGGHPGNAAGTHLVNVVSSKHGGHGFFFIGGDANVSLIEMCGADVNYGNGFREYAGTGNTYVGCYGQGNAGMLHDVGVDEPDFGQDFHNHDFYVVGSGVNYSTFFGCYSEASIDRIIFPASAFGGNISGENFTISSASGFGLLGGVMSGGPLKYRSRASFPNSSFINIGTQPTSPDDVLLLGRLIDGAERSPTWLSYEGKTRRWSLYSEGTAQGPVMEVPTRESKRYDRYPAPSFPNGIFIGAAVAGVPDDPSQISRCHWRIAPLPPSTTDTLGLHATYKKGDVVWQSDPAFGSALGQVCLTSGTQGTLLAAITATSSPAGVPDITVDDSSELAPGQLITIDGQSFEIKGLGTAAYLVCGTPETYDFTVPPVPPGPFTLDVWIDLRGVQTISFTAGDFVNPGVVTAAEVAALLTNWFDLYGAGSAKAEGTGGVVTITSNTTGENSRVRVTGGTANEKLGFTTDNVTRVYGTMETVPMTTGETLILSFDLGVTNDTITFSSLDLVQQDVIARINGVMGYECAVAADSASLIIQAPVSGVSVTISGTALADLGLVAGTTQYYFPSEVDTTHVTLATNATFAAPQAVTYKEATFGSFGRVEWKGTRDFDVTASTLIDDTTANSETIRLTGAPGAPVTLTFAALRDGWSGRFLNLSGQDITVSGAGGGLSVLIPALIGLNPPTQRLYIEDAGGGTLNVRAEAPPIAA